MKRRTGNKQDHNEAVKQKGKNPIKTKHATRFEFYN